MTAIQVQPVIMAGGSGTRFWPQSRRTQPKQHFVVLAIRLHQGGLSELELQMVRLQTGRGENLAGESASGHRDHPIVLFRHEACEWRGPAGTGLPRKHHQR